MGPVVSTVISLQNLDSELIGLDKFLRITLKRFGFRTNRVGQILKDYS